MKMIEACHEIKTPITGKELKELEQIARVCYKSENNIMAADESLIELYLFNEKLKK